MEQSDPIQIEDLNQLQREADKLIDRSSPSRHASMRACIDQSDLIPIEAEEL
jgi:hypothetical protein